MEEEEVLFLQVVNEQALVPKQESTPQSASIFQFKVMSDTQIAAHALVSIPTGLALSAGKNQCVIVTAAPQLVALGLLGASCLYESGKQVFINVFNTTSGVVTLKKGDVVGHFALVRQFKEVKLKLFK